MRERILTFGPNRGLVGILSEPAADVARPGAPIVISSNVGMNHRIGPYRVYVDLARHLAARGYASLRFDLSGMGDSAPRLDNVDEQKRALLDVQDAMAVLSAQRPNARFVQLGFCSGVDSAHLAAVRDARVVGAIFLEGYVFRTPRFYFERYVRRPLRARFWAMYARRKLAALLAPLRDERREVGELPDIYSRVVPTAHELQRDYAALIARDVRLLFVFSGGFGSDPHYNYREQFADCFPEIARDRYVEVQFYRDADHVYSVLADRARLIARISDWLCAHFT